MTGQLGAGAGWQGLRGGLGRRRGFLSHLWEFLLHRMIPKEQKEPVMAVPGDLAEPGKMDPALCLPQTLLGLRLWPGWASQQPLDVSVEYITDTS